jgi:protein-tyrosine phosphatase
MATELHWVEGPWRGNLALAARPRGGDWLDDEMASWRMSEVDTVVSLLERDEAEELGLRLEAGAAQHHGMRFVSVPIADRQVPDSKVLFSAEVERVDRELAAGRNVVIHCRQGIGRTGLLAACLLLGRDVPAQDALFRLSEARGLSVPETAEQRRWIDEFAETVVRR